MDEKPVLSQCLNRLTRFNLRGEFYHFQALYQFACIGRIETLIATQSRGSIGTQAEPAGLWATAVLRERAYRLHGKPGACVYLHLRADGVALSVEGGVKPKQDTSAAGAVDLLALYRIPDVTACSAGRMHRHQTASVISRRFTSLWPVPRRAVWLSLDPITPKRKRRGGLFSSKPLSASIYCNEPMGR